MRTVVVGERPPELEALIERRRALGLDLFDEVWGGDYHMAPAPHGRHGRVDYQLSRILGPLADRAGLRGSGPCNIGAPDDYRVPDQAYFANDEVRSFYPTAELVIEIVSPGDESRDKFEFYFFAGVKEVVIVDPGIQAVEWYGRQQAGFRPVEASSLLDISAAKLTKAIKWLR